MTESTIAETDSDVAKRSSPSPTVLWFPGTVFVLIGLWLTLEGDTGWGPALLVVGSALVLVGGVAQGVAWGMDIHKERHP